MTRAAIVHTQIAESVAAGTDLGRAILREMNGEPPDAVVLFASPVYDPKPFLGALQRECSPKAVAGCSSAGEFTFNGTLPSSAVALAIKSTEMRFRVHVGRDLQKSVRQAAEQLASTFELGAGGEYSHRTALMLVDTLAGYGEEFLDAFNAATEGQYQVFGGGAADEAKFEKTYIFAGHEVMQDAAVALEIRSKSPVGIGVSHGWTPASPKMTATATSGLRLDELDGRPAVERIEEFASKQGKQFDRENPLPFFLHHVLGIETPDGYKLRVPLLVDASGALTFAAEIPQNAIVRVMRTRDTSAAEAARVAANRARASLHGHTPVAAIFLDCAATRLRLGEKFGASVNEIADALGSTTGMGCNSFGQFARLEGQFSGYHNCTAVVCLLPE